MGFSSQVQYQFDLLLTRASVKGTVTVCRLDVGGCFDVALNLTWAGFGQLDRSNGVSHVHDGFNFVSQNLGTVRAATATGTVTQGAKNYTPDPSFAALLS